MRPIGRSGPRAAGDRRTRRARSRRERTQGGDPLAAGETSREDSGKISVTRARAKSGGSTPGAQVLVLLPGEGPGLRASFYVRCKNIFAVGREQLRKKMTTKGTKSHEGRPKNM